MQRTPALTLLGSAIAVLLAACTTSTPAPVVDRTARPVASAPTPPRPAPVSAPAPVQPGSTTQVPDAGDRLPAKQVAALMALQGVDGVWIEREPDGQRVVVIHYTPSARPTHLPQQVNGLPTRIVGGEPIRAQ